MSERSERTTGTSERTIGTSERSERTTDTSERSVGTSTAPSAGATFSVSSADGVEIVVHHLADGPPERPLLVSHATGFHARCYEPMAASLAGRFDVTGADLRGHGLSAVPVGADVDWVRYGDDAEAAAEAVAGTSPLVGFGHSMGATALLLAARRRPELFAGLVLYEPIVMPPEVRAADNPNRLAGGAYKRRRQFDSLDAAYDNFASKPPMNAFDPAALRAYVDGGLFPADPDDPRGPVVLRCDPEHEAATFDASTRLALWEHLGEITVPVLVIGGADAGDDLPAKLAPGIAERLGDARFEAHHELDHFGPFTHPAALAAIAVEAARDW